MSQVCYFVSDFHLGLDVLDSSRDRELKVVRWLQSIESEIGRLYIVGDIFDYWFEYSSAIPKGYIKFISQLSRMCDLGWKIEFFTGNHDMWQFRYFEDELGIVTHTSPIDIVLQDKRIILGHGDGLGPGDHGYKIIKKIFSNRICQWLYGWIHPTVGLAIMKYISGRSNRENDLNRSWQGADKEWLAQYAESHPDRDEIDYFIFGHRHLVVDYELKNKKTRYINIGDWIHHRSYAKLEDGNISIHFYENPDAQISYTNRTPT